MFLVVLGIYPLVSRLFPVHLSTPVSRYAWSLHTQQCLYFLLLLPIPDLTFFMTEIADLTCQKFFTMYSFLLHERPVTMMTAKRG